MSHCKQIINILISALLLTTTAFAQKPRLGTKLFEDAAYPQVIGNSGKISCYLYKTVAGETKLNLVIGDLTTGRVEPFDFETKEFPDFGSFGWSKDGTRCALTRKDLTTCDIYEYTRAKPFKITKLTDLTPYVPDINPKLRESLGVDKNQLLDAVNLEWSLDNKKIAFSMSSIKSSAVWILDIETGKLQQITKDRFGATPTWAPDGQTVYVAGVGNSTNPESEDIFAVKLSDYSVIPVTSDPAVEIEPNVSPDGRYIVYARRAPEARQSIYVYDLKLKKAVPLVILGPTGSCAYPVWTSDGKAVLYQYISKKTFPDIYKIDFAPTIFN